MSVLIVGSNGNMGLRYRAIFDYLKVGYLCADITHTSDQIREMAKKSEGILIATPTHTHCSMIERLSDLSIPILCEKPLSKNLGEVIDALRSVAKYGTPFSMVYQYGVLPSGKSGVTEYNYFKHGGDTLVWDCIQIIGIANGDVVLGETSPIWTCTLNGIKQKLGDMDLAYIEFIRRWMKEPKQDVGSLRDLHFKTAECEKRCGGSRYH